MYEYNFGSPKTIGDLILMQLHEVKPRQRVVFFRSPDVLDRYDRDTNRLILLADIVIVATSKLGVYTVHKVRHEDRLKRYIQIHIRPMYPSVVYTNNTISITSPEDRALLALTL